VSAPAQHSLDFAVQAMGGRILHTPAPVVGRFFSGAATDSRQVTPRRLFFALAGERVDGFDFCGAAATAGAAAVVVPRDRDRPAGCEAIPVIEVGDPRAALADLARAVRALFRGKVVGITGSNGKTTTKELAAAALTAAGPVLRTAGNLNTEVGLPLTILEATGNESFWVLEMAMRARGEIAFLTNIARPHVGLVTNVAAAHLGLLGSLEEVAKAKGEIFADLTADGVAVLPTAEPLLEAEAEHLAEARKRRFGGFGPKPTGPVADPGDVRILEFVPSGVDGAVVRFAVDDQPVVVRLPLPGEHNAGNAAAALAVVLALELPVRPAAAALAGVELPPHRSRTLNLGGRTVLDDCYNANPASMAAALRTLVGAVGTSRRALAVLGDMLELGPNADALHEDLGRLAARLGVAGLVAVGPLSERVAAGARQAGLDDDRVRVSQDPSAAAALVAAWSAPGDWILVKASRGLRLERAVEALQARLVEKT
jgi:UDP-N-acetylmuramoyl-tripeptide--D-alanyl-D-alanine ligase